jgi:nitrate/nitrite-specific signal transduction histidine kinase
LVVLWLRRETAMVAPELEPAYRIALAALIVFTAAIGITYAVVVRLFVRNPLKRLVAAMRRAREGDFLHRVPVESADEIGRLAEAYNATLAAVTDLHARRIEDARAFEALERELAVKAEAAKRVRELSFLADLGRTLASTLDLDELLRALAEGVARGLGLEALEVLLADEATGDLVVRAVHGLDAAREGARLRPGGTVPGLSTVAVRRGEDVVAVLAYRKPGGAPADEDEERLLQSVASQAAMAIANARLHGKMVG